MAHKDAFEVVKKENLMLNIKLAYYKLMSTTLEYGEVINESLSSFNNEFQKLKHDLTIFQKRNEVLESDIDITISFSKTAIRDTPF